MAKKIKEISPTDEIILQTYQLGWDDCFTNDDSNLLAFKDSPILTKAYHHGWADYIAGDDVTSIDAQTDEEILNCIKND